MPATATQLTSSAGRYGPDHAVQRLTELPVLYAYDAQRPGTDLLGAV